MLFQFLDNTVIEITSGNVLALGVLAPQGLCVSGGAKRKSLGSIHSFINEVPLTVFQKKIY